MVRQISLAIAITTGTMIAQVQNPTQQPVNGNPGDPVPIFRVEVVARTTPAVNYLHRGGDTKIDFAGTGIMPEARGVAKVESVRGAIHIDADFKNFRPPSSFGLEYLTYVLWAISPDGRPVNLGELTLNDYGNGSSSKLSATSDIQTFGMIVTAEPYYAVTQPSDAVVLENVIRPDTRGVIESVNAKYDLLPRGTYTSQGRASGFVPIRVGKHEPFELYEAENAVQLARVAGAEKYASQSFTDADAALEQALRYQDRHPGQKPVITMAREACVRAEDARTIAIRAARKEAADNERAAALARENAAKQQAAAEEQRRLEADAARAAAERTRELAMQAEQQAQRERLEAQQAQRQAEAAQAKAQADAINANQARAAAVDQQRQLAAQADLARQAQADAEAQRQRAEALQQQAEQEREHLRSQLLAQFNQILETRETARGLIVNMSDVLFDFNKYSLKPGAREKLAKISGIILGHPGLKIEVEGYTDSIGGDEYNQRLSENRAGSVRDFLVTEGIKSDSVSSRGFGKSDPVADNSSAAGRQMNRRVQLVVSGDILGAKLTTTTPSSRQ